MIEGRPLSSSGLQWGERERWLLELLACPDCRAPLLEAEAVLGCRGCGQQYAVTNGIPQLLPSALTTGTPTDPAWRAWAAAPDRLVAEGFPLSLLCRTLGVSRAGFYKRQQAPGARAPRPRSDNDALAQRIRTILDREETFGYRRVWA